MSLDSSDPSRRDILKNGGKMSLVGYATCACAGAGACSLAIPAINSLNGTNHSIASTLSQSSILETDLSDLAEGSFRIVRWRGLPVFIQHRTQVMLNELQKPELLTKLRDPESQRKQQPPEASNWHRSLKPEYLILINTCTHLGCTTLFEPKKDSSFHCPCHGSWFDGAGRVFKNMPAPFNLPVPPVSFKNTEKGLMLRIGESEQSPDFSLSSIEKL
ncbi:ubiquinol-cytochrome c reductase iron-sulfur subunit [Acetobacteraceae bacterium]|nr:ubiquinol-cytochrome c reductase iron-sulfur subunit [Acetobacteraceae bacterium]